MPNRIMKILMDIKPECNFSGSSDFITEELLDSFDIVALVSELEETFHVLIDGMDILPENFCNLEAIAALVCKSGGNVE